MKIRDLKEGIFDDILSRVKKSVQGQTKQEYVLPNDVLKKFEYIGQQINDAIFTPGSDLHRSLRADQRFKDNLENLVVNLVKTVQDKIVYSGDQQFKALVDRGVDLLPENNLKAAFVGHLNLNDPTLPKNFQGTVTQFIKQQKKNFDSLLNLFMQMAQDERTRGLQPSAAAAYQELQGWARDALNLIDNIKPAPQTKQKASQPKTAPGQTQATKPTQATQGGAGQFSEPQSHGGETYTKGPAGWVLAKDRRTPAPDNLVTDLDQALAQDQRLQAAGAAR